MRRTERAEKTSIPSDSEGNSQFISIPLRSRLSGSENRPRQRLHVDVAFWTTFFLLNSLLYLPVVLMDREDGSILPSFHFAGLTLDQVWRQIFVWRREPDLLRFNSEIVLFVALWTVWPWLRKSWIRFAFVLVYVLFFLYYLYEGVTFTFFSLEPVFYTQMRMATEGFSFFLENARVTTAFVAGTVLLIIGGAALVARLARFALPDNSPSPFSRAMLGMLAAIVVFQSVLIPNRIFRPEMVFSSMAAKLARNFSESQRMYESVKQTENANLRHVYDYSQFSLAKQPPIYIIFSESYGTVLYKRTDWWVRYKALTQRLDKELAGAGWHVASARSLAPTWGGGSWMSYTSALFGLRVSSDPQYYALLDRYQNEEYPDLGRFLKDQGYRYYRLTALSMGLPQSQWQKYVSFYGVDRWLQYEDLGFVGPEFGWGPAPPDQYSLNFARETMRSETEGPYLFFTITQNSHYPWTPQPKLVQRWQLLNEPGPAPPPSTELIEHSERRLNYWNAIEYQLEMLTDFILTEPNDEAIFVIVGDHQPPRVSRREDGWDTPMHIIAKNGTFVASFEEYGFKSGLAVWESEPSFRHEGFYSLFARQLLAAFGVGEELPPYLPAGAPIYEEAQQREPPPH